MANCGWSGTRQQHRVQHKANDGTKDVKNLSNFRNNKYENEERFAAKLWLERRYNNNTGDKNRNANRGGKYADRLEMFVRNMHNYDVLT